MRKFICFPLANIEKTEHFLKKMEQQGYRLQLVKYSRLFCFVKSQPKEVSYLIRYRLPRDFPSELHDWEMKLKSEYHALDVPTKHTNFDVFRITVDTPIDKEFFMCRNKYFKSIVKRLFCIFLFLILLWLVCLILHYTL